VLCKRVISEVGSIQFDLGSSVAFIFRYNVGTTPIGIYNEVG
jgi:hypothetical protein